MFPTLEEQGKAKEAITKNWDAVVGANVQVTSESIRAAHVAARILSKTVAGA